MSGTMHVKANTASVKAVRFMLKSLLISCSLIPAVASAQSQSNGPPLRVTFTDPRHIDLASGMINRNLGTLTIGPMVKPAFAYPILDSNVGPVAATPLNGVIYGECVPISQYNPCGFTVRHFLMGQREERANPGASVTDAGSTVNGYALTQKDGTVWNYSTAHANTQRTDPATGWSEWARLDSVVYPDGETLTYAYDPISSGQYSTPRVRSITSNYGYQLHYTGDAATGATGSIVLINLSSDYCDPHATSCPGISSSPFVNINYNAANWSVQDALGRTTNVGWQGSNNVFTSPAGVTYTVTQSIQGAAAPGYLNGCPGKNVTTSVVDANGTWNYQYNIDSSSQYCPIYQVTVSAPDGSSTSLTSGGGYHTQTNELGKKTSYVFPIASVFYHGLAQDSDNGLISGTFPEGNHLDYTYDDRYNLKLGTSTPKSNSNLSPLSSQNFYLDSCTASTMKICNKPIYTLDANNNRTDYTYDSNSGLILTETKPADANGHRPKVTYNYQQLSSSYQVASGQFASGAPIWKLTSTSTCRTQDSCAGTSDETLTTYTYDGNLRPTTVTVQAGDGSVSSATTTTYDTVGNAVFVDGPLPGGADTTRYVYNADRELVATMSPDPDGSGPLGVLVTKTTNNGDGQPIEVDEGTASDQSDGALAAFTLYRKTLLQYDTAGRKVSSSTIGNDGAQAVTQYSYDAHSRLTCTAVRMNPAVYSSLPTDACALSTQGTNGPDRITKNIYDAAGQLVQVRKAMGTSAEAAEATYAYSDNGKQTDIIDANGNHAQLSYDGFDRQVTWAFPSTSLPTAFNGSSPATALATAGSVNNGDYEAYGYDNNDNRTSLRKRDGSTLYYNYDALNRVISKIVPGRGDLPGTDTRSVYYSYDLQSHQTEARFDTSAGEGVSNGFDALGRQTTSSLTMDGVTHTVSLSYDAVGNRTRMTYPDQNSITYTYDALSRPSLILRSGAAQIASYDYDAIGRRTGFNGGVSTSYTYDGLNHLKSLTNAPNNNGAYANTYGFGYNPASQITSLSKSNNSFVFNGIYNTNRSYSINGLNQYVAAGSASFVYDANGNLTGDASTTFLYDIENRLVAAGGNKQAHLRYDPLGRLYEMAAPTGTTRFFYNGDELIGEYDTSGNLLRRYAHGADLKSDDPIAWYEGSGFDSPYERFLRQDHQGSIALVTDNSGSTIYAANTFDEYGIPGSNNSGRFQYTGQAWMPELGMYYYKARFYSPTLGRFMQTDPIGYKDQVNLYAYVGNDPMDKVDYTGEVAGVDDAAAATVVGIALGAAYVCHVSGACENFSHVVYQGVDKLAGYIFHNNAAQPAPTPTSKPAPGKPQVNPDKQGKHVPGHKNFQPGKGEVTHPDPQGLVNDSAGTGQQVGNTPVGDAGSKERVDFGQPIGTHVDGATGNRSTTDKGIIHYGKNDVHIVPARP